MTRACASFGTHEACVRVLTLSSAGLPAGTTMHTCIHSCIHLFLSISLFCFLSREIDENRARRLPNGKCTKARTVTPSLDCRSPILLRSDLLSNKLAYDGSGTIVRCASGARVPYAWGAWQHTEQRRCSAGSATSPEGERG